MYLSLNFFGFFLLLELTAGQTAGIAISAVALFIIGIVAAYLFYRSYKSRKVDDDDDDDNHKEDARYNPEDQTVATFHNARTPMNNVTISPEL